MKTIEKIQKFANVGKMISRVLLIVSILSITISIVALMFVILSGEMSVDVKDYTIGSLFKDSSRLASLDLIIYIIALAIYFIGHTYLWNSAYRYFAVEAKSGTPFKNENYINLRSLGIATILFSTIFELITLMLLNLATEHIFSGSIIMEYNPFTTLALGIMIIVASLISRYGAELEANKKEKAQL